jgi:phosphoglycolate phosphatase
MTDLAGAAIAFDLDGTLVDTAPDLHRALNHVLVAEGLPETSLVDVRAFVGHGARALIRRAASAHGRPYEDTRLDALTEAFVEVYASDIARFSQVFDGVEETLRSLAASGARLCVCTNKRTGLSNQLLEAVGLSGHFAAVIGADSVPKAKPDAGHLLAAIQAIGGDPARSLMVGDSISDVGAARNAGAPVILVTFGYTDTPAEQLGADAVISHYSQLPALVRTWIRR